MIHSQLFPLFHSEFSTSFELPFDEKYKLIVKRTKKILVDTRAQFNFVYKNWKKSGNGRYNKKVREIATLDGERDDAPVENEEEEYVDDDRFDFVRKRGIHIGYFWCVDKRSGLA